MANEQINNEDVSKASADAVKNDTTANNATATDTMSAPEAAATDNVSDATDAPQAEVAEPSDSEADKVAAEVAEWKDKFMRLQAEFDNYRKRTLREKMELVENGGANVIKAMLPVVDDVDRAVDAIDRSDDIEALRAGVKLIHQKFHDTLKSCGLSEIEAKGLALDTDHHEAVARFQAGEESRGKIIDVVQKGYKLRDKVLRFALVVVGE
jgi:molecular chaperone GrpE